MDKVKIARKIHRYALVEEKKLEEPYKSDLILAKKIIRKVKELEDLINSSDKFSVHITATGLLRKSGVIETRPGHHITLRVGRELGSFNN